MFLNLIAWNFSNFSQDIGGSDKQKSEFKKAEQAQFQAEFAKDSFLFPFGPRTPFLPRTLDSKHQTCHNPQATKNQDLNPDSLTASPGCGIPYSSMMRPWQDIVKCGFMMVSCWHEKAPVLLHPI